MASRLLVQVERFFQASHTEQDETVEQRHKCRQHFFSGVASCHHTQLHSASVHDDDLVLAATTLKLYSQLVLLVGNYMHVLAWQT